MFDPFSRDLESRYFHRKGKPEGPGARDFVAACTQTHILRPPFPQLENPFVAPPRPVTFRRALLPAHITTKAAKHGDEAFYEHCPWLYYDSRGFELGNSVPFELLFFVEPLGPRKDKAATNMKQAGRLPDPEQFTVRRIEITVEGDPADTQRIRDGYYLEFEIGDRTCAEGPVSEFAKPPGRHFGDEGLVILQSRCFQLRMRSSMTLAPLRVQAPLTIRAFLDGVSYRPLL